MDFSELREAIVSYGENLFIEDVQINKRMGEFGAQDIIKNSGGCRSECFWTADMNTLHNLNKILNEDHVLAAKFESALGKYFKYFKPRGKREFIWLWILVILCIRVQRDVCNLQNKCCFMYLVPSQAKSIGLACEPYLNVRLGAIKVFKR